MQFLYHDIVQNEFLLSFCNRNYKSSFMLTLSSTFYLCSCIFVNFIRIYAIEVFLHGKITLLTVPTYLHEIWVHAVSKIEFLVNALRICCKQLNTYKHVFWRNFIYEVKTKTIVIREISQIIIIIITTTVNQAINCWMILCERFTNFFYQRWFILNHLRSIATFQFLPNIFDRA